MCVDELASKSSIYFWGVMPSILLKVRCRMVRSVKPQSCLAVASSGFPCLHGLLHLAYHLGRQYGSVGSASVCQLFIIQTFQFFLYLGGVLLGGIAGENNNLPIPTCIHKIA